MRSLAAEDSQPKAIYTASVNQLKALVVRYFLQDGIAVSVWVGPAFLVLVSALLRDGGAADPSNRLYLLLCIRCCSNLHTAYPVFHDVTRAYLSMALDSRAISSDEAQSLSAFLQGQGEHHADLKEAVSSAFVDPVLALTAPERAGARSLAETLEDNQMFEEFTTGKTAI